MIEKFLKIIKYSQCPFGFILTAFFYTILKVLQLYSTTILKVSYILILILYSRGRQPFERSVPFFDSVTIETSPRAKRMPYFPLKISVQTIKRSSKVNLLNLKHLKFA